MKSAAELMNFRKFEASDRNCTNCGIGCRLRFFIYRRNVALFCATHILGSSCSSFICRGYIFSAPIRKQLRDQAEANARVQSHLVKHWVAWKQSKDKEWKYTADGGNNFMVDKFSLDLEMS